MIEILVLVWITGIIGRIAERKGKRPGLWKLYTVVAWILGEVIGIMIAVKWFRAGDYIAMFPWAIMGAIGGYLLVRAIISNMPDKPMDSFEFEDTDAK